MWITDHPIPDCREHKDFAGKSAIPLGSILDRRDHDGTGFDPRGIGAYHWKRRKNNEV
jgi:hypothetical protein